MTPAEWQQLKELFHTAIELDLDKRASFLDKACAGDTELRLHIEKLLASHVGAGAFLQSSAAIDVGAIELPTEEQVSGKRVGPYEVVRELGHGGMGTVYLAVRADDQYSKQVAIKLVNRGMDTDLILRRFTMERQILANLEHPNIARLLEGGSTPDGLPYFVMEYIEGVPINDYCDAHRLSTAQRLELFREVCDALHYAHQNLVVHRDIKPSNILVTDDGVPKLLDFGIAKLLSPGWMVETGESTASMVRLMTPEYASPEQLRGISITTASDVYSLGVVLYELLSGHHPYQLNSRRLEEVVQVILEEEPLKPSVAVTRTESGEQIQSTDHEKIQKREGSVEKLRRRLSGDLDNIVLKALRKEPGRRYASVQEFSDDLRRHLEGLPVAASPDTFSYRAGKFVQRHKAGVLAGAIVVITLLTATGVTAWQARVARRERDKAERRFNQVRKLANSVLFEYHDGIEKLPGSTPVRERMVKDALEYLDNLSAESAGDSALKRELATAYEKVGDVQGAPFRSNLGNFKGALESHRKAMVIREGLNNKTADESLKLELARSYGAIGELLFVTGDLPTALTHYAKEFAIFDLLKNVTVETRRESSTLAVRFGRALAASGKLKEAVASFQKGIMIANDLSATSKEDRLLIRAKAFAHIYLGDAYADMGQLNEALESERAAFALLEPLLNETDAQSRRDVAVAYVRVADVMSKMGNKRAALEMEEKALVQDQEAVKVDPSNALARRDVYIDYYKIAFMQEALGDMEPALANQRQCITLVEASVSRNPTSAESLADLAVAYFRYGEMLEHVHDAPNALQSYKKAVAIEESMSKADPTNTVTRGDLSEDYMKVSDVTLKLGNSSDALEGYLKALAIREDLVTKSPEDAEGRTQLARIYESLGEYNFLLAKKEGRAETWQEAQRRFNQGLIIWTALKNEGKLLPEYARKPDEVAQKVGSCVDALSRYAHHPTSREQ